MGAREMPRVHPAASDDPQSNSAFCNKRVFNFAAAIKMSGYALQFMYRKGVTGHFGRALLSIITL